MRQHVGMTSEGLLQLQRPVGFLLELTGRCQHSCRHCGTRERSNSTLLPQEDWFRILDTILPSAKRIAISGGEPTLHPGFDSILRHSASGRAQVSVFTNGRWTHPQRVLDALRAVQLNTVLITLMGHTAHLHDWHTRSPGGFEATTQAIRACADSGLPVVINTVLTTKNIGHIAEIAALGHDLGADYTQFDRLLPIAEEGQASCPAPADLLAAATQLLGGHVPYGRFSLDCIPPCFIGELAGSCLAGHCSLSIGPTGDVRPCARSDVVLGNACTRSIHEMWKGEMLRDWSAQLPEPCTLCGAYGECMGACKVADRYYNGRDPVLDAVAPWPEDKPTENSSVLCATDAIQALYEILEQPFGAALLMGKHVLPVNTQGRQVCSFLLDNPTVADVEALYGQPGIDLVDRLYARSFVDFLPANHE